jgi:hypothetical protein
MGIGSILIAVGVVGLMMSLFWILSRPPRGFAARDDC